VPIYDYLCSNCRHLTEVIHGINDPGPRFCPACGAEGTMKKAMSTPTVHFKGSGWAKKDRSSTSGARSKAAGNPSSTEGASADGPKPSADGADSSGGSSESSETTKKPASSTASED
jgi:putative FmdB family regulatory protein